MVSVSFPEIAHLIHGEEVTPEEVSFHFVSDCQNYRRTVVVARPTATPPPPETAQKALSRWIKMVLRQVFQPTARPVYVTQQEREKLGLQAFEQLLPALTRVDGRWVALSHDKHPGEFFERQLHTAPIAEPYDREVLTRVLLEVSRSDSHWRQEEKAFLEELVGDQTVITRLQKAPNLTISELAEVSSVEVKQTILMLAWAMAYADGTLDPQEMTRLTQLCRGFMLPEPRVRELQLAAKLSLLDRFLQTQRDQLSAEELRQRFDRKALEWGVCQENLSKLHAWYPRDFSHGT